LLLQAKDWVDDKLSEFNSRTKTTGCTLCSDGWDDAQHNPLLNILIVNPKGEKFIKAVDTTGHRKDAVYMAGILMAAIDQVGAEHVVQICTDSASVCKRAAEIVLDE